MADEQETGFSGLAGSPEQPTSEDRVGPPATPTAAARGAHRWVAAPVLSPSCTGPYCLLPEKCVFLVQTCVGVPSCSDRARRAVPLESRRAKLCPVFDTFADTFLEPSWYRHVQHRRPHRRLRGQPGD
ncbi:hypothetical protein MTO96_012339 [Rhipicephalus appendiculatus]